MVAAKMRKRGRQITRGHAGRTEEMRRREFGYAQVYRHPRVRGAAFDSATARIKPEIPRRVARLCKNESNCTVFLADGTWFTTWSQGSFEHAPDERIVFSVSRDMGRHWRPPRTIVSSTARQRIAYGIPFVAAATQRVYLFFFATSRRPAPLYDAGHLHFVYSDDCGRSWSRRRRIRLPSRDINVLGDQFHAWVNHPPQTMPTDETLFTFTAWRAGGLNLRCWRLNPAEVFLVRCDNILTETRPGKLRFTLLPEGPRGIRVDVFQHRRNPSLRRLLEVFDGLPEESGFNFQEMTVVPFSGGRWLGVGRTYLGSPGWSVSRDRGRTWSAVEPLRYAPGGKPIMHPMTMCPIARTSDGRFVLLFTNNDGRRRGAKHVWDGSGRTRNPQWIVVGRELARSRSNAGLVFGKPRVLAAVNDRGESNLKTGISMPQFFERDGRYFVCYNINKEHILLDEIPARVLDRLTPTTHG